jgi:hypothetical protein
VISRKFFLVLVTLLVVDVVFGMLSGFFQNVEYFSQKSSATVVSDLAFLEGAIILFLGVVLMFYHSRFGSREANLIVFAVVMFCVSVVSGLVG